MSTPSTDPPPPPPCPPPSSLPSLSDFDLPGLHRWLTSISVITFDLEAGPSLEYSFPPHSIPPSSTPTLCGLAFPDSHCAVMGDTSFVFRMRSPPLFGYTTFRQRKDASNARGYFQKSVVVLSALPCLSLFTKVCGQVSDAYHRYGPGVVEAACQTISKWTAPRGGMRVQLPLLGAMIVDVLPLWTDAPAQRKDGEGTEGGKEEEREGDGGSPSALNGSQQQSQAEKKGTANLSSSQSMPQLSTGVQPLSPSPSSPGVPAAMNLSTLFASIHHTAGGVGFHSINLYTTFREHLHNLWLLWELSITGQPLLILARTPHASSNAVLGLLSLISPVVYCGDYRPYFTIYDPDFKHYTTLHDRDPSALSAVMLGVTNPFFLKAMERFPNILILGGADPNDPPMPDSPTTSPQSPRVRLMHKISKSVDASSIDSSRLPALLISKTNPTLIPDETTLKRLILEQPVSPTSPKSPVPVPAASGAEEINNAVLRKSFSELTQAFLKPFAPFILVTPEYQQSLMTDPHWNPYITVPTLPRYSEAELIGNIKEDELRGFPMSGMKAGRRHKMVELYKKFVRGVHFVQWYAGMREDAEAQIWAMIVARVKKLSEGGGEVMENLLGAKKPTGDEILAMWKVAQGYLEKLVTAANVENGLDIACVSGLLLHQAMMKRNAPIEVMMVIEKMEKEKAWVIELFAKKQKEMTERIKQNNNVAQGGGGGGGGGNAGGAVVRDRGVNGAVAMGKPAVSSSAVQQK